MVTLFIFVSLQNKALSPNMSCTQLDNMKPEMKFLFFDKNFFIKSKEKKVGKKVPKLGKMSLGKK